VLSSLYYALAFYSWTIAPFAIFAAVRGAPVILAAAKGKFGSKNKRFPLGLQLTMVWVVELI